MIYDNENEKDEISTPALIVTVLCVAITILLVGYGFILMWNGQ